MVDRIALIRLYWFEGMTLRAIGEIYFVANVTISRWMKRLNIPRRNTSEARIQGKIGVGRNNPMYGKTHSDEAKQKMREKKIGIKLSEDHKKNIGLAGKGKIGPESQKNKVKEFMLNWHRDNLGIFAGKNNPCWRGGLSFEPYSTEFNNQLKEQIRERDDRLCQFCGVKENGRKHDVHHINYNKKDCRPKNLITVCQDCNKRANFERTKWQFLFEILQELRSI